MFAFEWAEDSFAGHLLPPRASLVITHDEVLIVNAGKMKVKYPPLNCRLPHQTGVTECSISGHDRSAANRVLNDVMIGHQANRISHSFSIVRHGQHHV